MSPNKKGTVYILFNGPDSSYRFRAAKFVQEQGYVPVYPAIMNDFFGVRKKNPKGMDERVMLVKKADQLWVFGKVTAAMLELITLAKNSGKQVRGFSIDNGEFVRNSPY